MLPSKAAAVVTVTAIVAIAALLLYISISELFKYKPIYSHTTTIHRKNVRNLRAQKTSEETIRKLKSQQVCKNGNESEENGLGADKSKMQRTAAHPRAESRSESQHGLRLRSNPQDVKKIPRADKHQNQRNARNKGRIQKHQVATIQPKIVPEKDSEKINLQEALERNEAIDAQIMDQIEEHRRKLQQDKSRASIIGMDHENHFNFGFCGMSGSGKSTLINNLRGCRANDDKAAKTQAGVECTQEVGQYMLNDYVALWDMPGAFTEAHPAKTYCADRCLDLFDCIVMCYTGRWCEINTVIAQYAIDHKIPMILVYTDTKYCVDNEARDTGVSKCNAFVSLANRVRRDLEKYFSRLCPPQALPELFLVESFSLFPMPNNIIQYQEVQLLEALIRITATRNPDGLTADELPNIVVRHVVPAPAAVAQTQ